MLAGEERGDRSSKVLLIYRAMPTKDRWQNPVKILAPLRIGSLKVFLHNGFNKLALCLNSTTYLVLAVIF